MMTTPEMEEVVGRVEAALADHRDVEFVRPRVNLKVSDLRALLSERRKMVEALEEARRCIATERETLIDCHTVRGRMETLDTAAEHPLADYDATLALIAAALTGRREHG